MSRIAPCGRGYRPRSFVGVSTAFPAAADARGITVGASFRRGRRLLVVAAVTVAALAPTAGADAMTRPRTMSDDRPATVGVVEPGFPIDHLGVLFELPEGAATDHGHVGTSHPGVHGVAVRFRTDGTWGPWQPVGEDGAQAEGQWTGALVPGGDAEAYQVRGIPAWARDARVAAINTTDGPAEVVGYRARGAAEASAPCRSRADWGADESLGTHAGRAYADLQVVTVHHTATQNDDPDPAATIRAIQDWHTTHNGWDDIGYQALVGPDGVVYEGRWSGSDSVSCVTAGGDGRDFGHETTADDAPVVTGAHAGGWNTGNYGVAMLGTYTDVAPPAAARTALVAHVAEVAGRHGLDPLGTVAYDNGTNRETLPAVLGHRDVTSTECPGGVLYADLPAIRQDVAAALATPTDPDPTTPPPTDEPAPAPTAAVATGETTVAGTVDGSWTATTEAGGAVEAADRGRVRRQAVAPHVRARAHLDRPGRGRGGRARGDRHRVQLERQGRVRVRRLQRRRGDLDDRGRAARRLLRDPVGQPARHA